MNERCTQIRISDSVKDIAELETRLQRAEELLREIRSSVDNPDPMDDWDKKIDAYFGGHHDGN